MEHFIIENGKLGMRYSEIIIIGHLLAIVIMFVAVIIAGRRK